MRTKRFAGFVMGVLVMSLMACARGESADSRESDDADDDQGAMTGGLTAEQMERGIGPIHQVSLGALDKALADQGQAVFGLKCAACHKMDQRYVGPPLGQVLERRKPEYVMNMILNPAEMVEKHPAAKELLAQFLTPMPNQNLTQDEARAVLEYLRSASAPGQKPETSER